MSGPFWARCAISFSMRDVEEAVFFLTYVSDSQRHTYAFLDSILHSCLFFRRNAFSNFWLRLGWCSALLFRAWDSRPLEWLESLRHGQGPSLRTIVYRQKKITTRKNAPNSDWSRNKGPRPPNVQLVRQKILTALHIHAPGAVSAGRSSHLT
mgnify:FL=1